MAYVAGVRVLAGIAAGATGLVLREASSAEPNSQRNELSCYNRVP